MLYEAPSEMDKCQPTETAAPLILGLNAALFGYRAVFHSLKSLYLPLQQSVALLQIFYAVSGHISHADNSTHILGGCRLTGLAGQKHRSPLILFILLSGCVHLLATVHCHFGRITSRRCE